MNGVKVCDGAKVSDWVKVKISDAAKMSDYTDGYGINVSDEVDRDGV